MKKKLLTVLLAGSMMAALAGCSGNPGSASTAAPGEVTGEDLTETEGTAENDAKGSGAGTEELDGNAGNGLVVYFSWSGNTESVALEITGQTGADVFKLEPQEPYTTDYDELLDVAQEEQGADARPAIAAAIDDLDSYDVIYLGYPKMEYGFLCVSCA